MTLKEKTELLLTEIETKFRVKDFLESIDANVESPGERELDMLWRWFIKTKQRRHVIYDGNPITRIHLAIYMRDRFNDDWYFKFQKQKNDRDKTSSGSRLEKVD
tara:strand:+ start:44 stop:355 length:312 start_codon:yes stop_codon:yes gene_type:complete